MNIIRKPLARLALGLTLLSPVAVQAQDADTVLATVGGEEITLGHLIAVASSLPTQFQQLADDRLYSGLLEQMIRQVALAQSMGDSLSKELELSLESQRWALMANSIIDGAIEAAVTEESVQALYDAEFGNIEPEKEFNASHILVETEEEAQALVTELEGGADFAELARARSVGPSGPNGGELGWFGPGMMVAPFEMAVIRMEPGTVSEPVETQFGWHVIRLNDIRDSAAQPLEEVRGRLEERLSEEAAQEVVDSLVAATEITRSEAEIDPALIRDTSLLD
ncbi:PpiC-type peptidyl-prolyl cis-trans isomerase [Dinoroseobacter shibae DFL 12 = DSM 16493]|uniref:Parvulin-like PPIase n=1 Tax=Dinoroseobacter shibae (strain DSM 16493 / NCIMB 14021 / DFL 12) TaxID=398580 RepID=A8LQ59_DINSH|nr:peptidylprolyl isomerase [Dinoroseobacter shibae]ABV95299.1 PpiC-type peptidyl-prolyl cis-trans isomerase [Dinoroseobacter shibae DFL 12 = DSM 16493]URF46705.1 peptidylprolyl isomerase [Dinoroseobacter shibae]URF51016.1 peptidylprolyl isomerase [Dinoroseobacter shibae]